MIGVNSSWIKSWREKKLNPSQQFTNESGSWKQSTSSQIYINLVHPVYPIHYLHMCKGTEINQKGEICWYHRANIFMSNLTGSQEKKNLDQSKEKEKRVKRKISHRKWLYPSCSVLLTYFVSKTFVWSTYGKATNTTFVRQCNIVPKQHRCPVVKDTLFSIFLLILIHGIAIHIQAPRWSQWNVVRLEHNLCSESDIDEATLVSTTRKSSESEIRQISITSWQEIKAFTATGRI